MTTGINCEFVNTVCLIVSLIAALSDYRDGKIKNRLVYPAMGAGIVFAYLCNGESGLWNAFLGLSIPLVLLPFFMGRMLGAGDIKLLMAIGAWRGLEGNIGVLMYSIIFGGILALFFTIRDNTIQLMGRKLQYLFISLASGNILLNFRWGQRMPKRGIPFAVAVFLGVVAEVL